MCLGGPAKAHLHVFVDARTGSRCATSRTGAISSEMSKIIPCKNFTSKLFQPRAVQALLLDETILRGQGDFVAYLNYKTLPISS